MKKLIAVAAFAATFAGTAKAEDSAWAWSPLGIGIAAPVQLPFTDTDIYGLRLGGVFGWNADVYGIDAGVASLETGSLAGLQCAAFTWTAGSAYGLQCAALANVVDGDVYALQLAAVNVGWGDVWGLQAGVVDYCNSFRGWQIGGIDWNNALSFGLQTAVVNANQEEFVGGSLGAINYSLRATGCQIGVLNLADSLTGVQVGAINAAQHARGIQIGLINIISEAPVPIMVIANASF